MSDIVYTESTDPPVETKENDALPLMGTKPSLQNVQINPIAQSLNKSTSALDEALPSSREAGSQAAQVLKQALPERFINTQVWFDKDQDSTASGCTRGISFSRNVVSFLTQGSTDSPHWQRDMRIALGLHKNIVLLGETDEQNGKPVIDQLIARCPEDLKSIFNDNVIIPYFADKDFMAVTFDKMARVLPKEDHTVRDTTSSRNKGHELRYAQHEADADSVVFHRFFVLFAAAVGMGLPGSKRTIRRYSKVVKWLLCLCFPLNILRFFLPEGPAFLDHLAVAQLVAMYPLVLFMGTQLQKLLRMSIIDDLLENYINAPLDAQRLHKRVRRLTAVAVGLTVLLTVWGWIAYLPGYYFDAVLHSGGDHVPVLGVISFIHGVLWIFTLPLLLGWFCTSLIIMFVLQELCFMALATCYGELHPEIGHRGIETVAATPAAMNVKAEQLFDLSCVYRGSWILYRQIQWRVAPHYYVFWTFQVGFLVWSLWSLGQGVETLPASDERVQRLQNHWSLVLRLAWFFGGSPWFGVASWAMGLMPFTAVLYVWRMRTTLTQRLFFTIPDLRVPFQNFIADLELFYQVLLIQATPQFFLAFATILLVNTAGFAADATRLFRSL
eukprot:s2435_g4.t1